MIRTLDAVPYDRSYEYFLSAFTSPDGQYWRRMFHSRSTPNDSPFAAMLAVPRVDAPFVYEKWWKRKRGARKWRKHATFRSWP